MRFHQVPRPLLQLITTILLGPKFTTASPYGFSLNDLFGRDTCAGTACGYYNQLCCTDGQACYTDANSIASCTASGAQATAAGGHWQYYTTTYVETDLTTITSTMSSYLGVATAAATGSCVWAQNQTPCGSTCCNSGEYCYNAQSGTCKPAAGGGSSGYYSSYATGTGVTAGAPIRPTSSNGVVVTATVSPTTTVPFTSPVATGANVTLTGESSSGGGGGLSGGAIAGIVIGVLAGVLLLALICFYCCVRGLLDGCLACFGLGGRRKRTVEVEEYERRSHHTSGGGAGGVRRTWYGTARPAARVDRQRRESHTGRNLLGIGAGLAALWAILGLKRRRENRKQEEKYSEYSYSSDYLLPGSASSDDRHDDRRTQRTYRSQSRR